MRVRNEEGMKQHVSERAYYGFGVALWGKVSPCFLVLLLLPYLGVSQQMHLPFAGPQPLTSTEKEEAAEIMDLMTKIESATVRGDVAYVDSVTSPDFIMVHGAGWTTGGKVAAADNKAAYLKRVKDKEYLVHDLDPSSIHFEFHGDVVICWGRYISLFMPPERTSNGPGHLTSIWFERVFQRQSGRWVYLSHRSVRTQLSPAGIDPGEVTTVTVEGPGLVQTAGYTLTLDGTIANRPRGMKNEALPPSRAVRGSVEETPDTSPDALAVLNLEKKIGEATINGDVSFWDNNVADDFSMTHGDIWTRGGESLGVDNKTTFGERVKNKQYLAYIVDHSIVELHGDVAITHGRYLASLRSSNPDWFSCWFEKIYEKRNGEWVVLSHRTVHGATHGPTRESVLDK